MSHIANEIAEILRNVEIIDSHHFSLSGVPIVCQENNFAVPPTDQSPIHGMPAQAVGADQTGEAGAQVAHQSLISSLMSTLYVWTYTKRFSSAEWLSHNQVAQQQYQAQQPQHQPGVAYINPQAQQPPHQPWAVNPNMPQQPVAPQQSQEQMNFIAQLSQANHTQPRLDGGWKIYNINQNGVVSVEKGDDFRTAHPGEFIDTSGTTQQPAVGNIVSIVINKESLVLQPGFYYCLSHQPLAESDHHELLRIYFNCTAQGAIQIVDQLSRQLNQYEIPFRFKCLSDLNQYGDRRDSAVLYFTKRYFNLVHRLLGGMLPHIANGLNNDVPLFSKEIYPGISLAEDPANGDSFGMHRSRLIATGIVNAWLNTKTSFDEKLAAVTQCFKENSIDINTPYLNKAGEDNYYNHFPEGIRL